MESFYALALIAGILVAFVLLVLIAIYHNSFKVEIPPDADQPLKLRFYHYIYILMEILAKNLESLGVFEEHVLIRLLVDGLPAGRDSKCFIKDLHFDEVPVRIYCPRVPAANKRRGVVVFHGGCGMFGSIRSHERICRYIARKTDSVTVSVGYVLSPEHEYPAQTLDCLTATMHFLKTAENYGVDPHRIIVCGDSVGGTFAARVCQELGNRRDIPKIRAQVLIYPFLQALNFNLPSHQKNAFSAFLSREHTVKFLLKYLKKDCSMKDAVLAGSHIPESINLKYKKWINPDLIPEIFKLGYKPPLPSSFLPQVHEETKEVVETRLSPLLAEDAVVCCLPDTCIITCEHDVLRDDGLLYKKRLEDNNVKVTWFNVEGGFHCALGFFGYGILSFPSSSKIMNHTVNFIKGY
ncbi:PREDICTED: arylacetamide deacetylase-like 4 [Nestor notabilis]|uniref:arylacetamide deacetylase-like 4 n=1 Tax=Nestor notabilis TaxID=176057 RepID=UPI000523F102|nr:PREDICTED: arylacetamide deacetylase-like 4 [Nestor notabilis]